MTSKGNRLLSARGTTVFETMSRLATTHNSVNLGQGFPDQDGPESMFRVLDEITRSGPNQYPPMLGIPELRRAVARHDQECYGLAVDWRREVMVTSGATEALAACFLGLLNPGDEIIVFEPAYDSYLPMIRLAGATPRLVRLKPPDWRLPLDELKAAFSSRTAALLLNNPMNPTGKVFSRAELDIIAALITRYDAVAICDEVYEHLIFDGQPHVPLMALDGIRDRALRIGSAGKTFSLTGWKVGYVTAAADLIQAISRAHQFLVFTTPPNLQRAVAHGLDNEREWTLALRDSLQRKRDYVHSALERVGFDVLPCQSTYFINANIRPLRSGQDDVAFCEQMTERAGVTAVPVSAFYDGSGPDNLVRFCFCKREDVLDDAMTRLAAYYNPDRS